MDLPRVYYNQDLIKITFEPEKKGYWIGFKDIKQDYSNYFVDEIIFENILNSDNVTRFSKLKLENELIPSYLIRHNIDVVSLYTALDEVKTTLENELKEFKKTL